MLVMFSNVCVWLAQAVRKNFRTLMNGLFIGPITRGSPPEVQAIAQLITGKTLNPADSGHTIVLIHHDHNLREGIPDRAAFVFCPDTAKGARSSMHSLASERQKDFFKWTQSISRIGPLFDKEGKQINHLEQDKFVHPTAESPLFNVITAYFYFNAMAKGPRMAEGFLEQIERRSDGTHDMTKVFETRVITPAGEDGEHVLGPRFMALADFYIATAIFGGIPAAQEYRAYYTFRAKQYAALTGEGGSRNMRAELQAVLEDYLNKYPHTLAQVRRSRKKSGAFKATAREDEVVDLTTLRDSFAVGPAGGTEAMQFPSGSDAAAVRSGEGGSGDGAGLPTGEGGEGGAPQASETGAA